MLRFTWLWACVCLSLAMAGCGDDGQYASVSGKVTMDGEPLVGGHVLFQPMASPDGINPGMPSKGITDEQGRYTLRLIQPDRDGVLLGQHRVMITIPSEENAPGDVSRPVFKMPNEWRTGVHQFEVTAEGTDQANFVIETNQ